MDITIFILKVFALSLSISLGIKYLMPSLAIAPTDTNALIAVLSPTLIMSIGLLLRLNHQPKEL
jgi:hypothetical protein